MDCKDFNTFCEELFELRRDRGINPSLEPMKKILEVFDNPQDKLKCIHVAGTNGKGSVCAMICSALSCANYKVGLYTSPHLVDVRERFVIREEQKKSQIAESDFIAYVNRIRGKADEHHIKLTFFELMTTLAFLYFSEKNLDYAVIETGLGGTWDATNVITPVISVLTSIAIDHVEFLGKDVESIAKDKCGIIKEKVPAVTCSANENNRALHVIKQCAREKHTQLFVAQPYEGKISLAGDFQKINAGIAKKVCEQFSLPQETIIAGIANAHILGRCEFLEDNLLVDGAHNVSGMKALAQYVKSIKDKYDSVTLLFGVGKRKNYEEMIKELPEHDLLIVTQSTHESSLDPGELGQGMVIPDYKEALITARELSPKALIVVCGSLYLVGDVMRYIQNKEEN